MTTIRSELQQKAQSTLIQYAVFRVESALIIAMNADEAHEWVVVPLVQVPITVALQHYSRREKARRLPACRPI